MPKDKVEKPSKLEKILEKERKNNSFPAT